MNVTWSGRTVTYVILAIFLCLIVVGAFRGAHSIGSGLAFNEYLQSNGYTIDDWISMSESNKAYVRRNTSAEGLPYATFIAIGTLFMGLAVIASVAYTLREQFFTRLKASVVALVLSGLAGMSSALANMQLGSSSDSSWYGGVGIGIVVFVAFYILTGVLALGRKAVFSVFQLGEQQDIAVAPDPEFARTDENADSDRPNWWRRQSATFRQWAFGSFLWIVFVFFIVVLFEPFTDRYDIDDDEYIARMFFVMILPLAAASIRYAYNKFVK